MKKRINFQLVVTAIISICATLLLVVIAFYELFCEQIMADLKTYSNILEETKVLEKIVSGEYVLTDDSIRITWISVEGGVLYDSHVDITTMENHANRPEVIQALFGKEGTAVRKSETLDKSTFYYAQKLEEGNILRVSKESDSVWSMFFRAVPSTFVMLVILLTSCMFMAHFLTKRFIAPIEQLAKNLDDVEEIEAYEELQPFMAMIQKQHEDILKNARIRQEFTANVSHELKTPLTSISGYAELIETGMASDEDVIRFAKGIHKNSNRLLTLINDIIRLSELDGTEYEEVFEKINLYQLAQACVDMLQLNAEKHNVTLKLEGNECYVLGNKQMLEEVLYNLCDNAIRYNNEKGVVTVQVFSKKERTILIVQDTGIGIPKKSQERVFERFYRVDKSRSKSTGGTGLGLAIVKHIIAKHHATIDLQSEVDKGTKITVTF